MPFIPHTEEEVQVMLDAIGAPDIDALFDEIPAYLKLDRLRGVPDALSEMEISRLMRNRAARDGQPLCFIGAGAYEHHIPAAVWEIVGRGEFYSAYTPYQAEASQGTLQVIYEYQSMMTALTALDVSNASLYDGASALAEAVLMAVRANRKSRSGRVLMPDTVHPYYREVVHNICSAQGIVQVPLPYRRDTGTCDLDALDSLAGEDFAAVVIPHPNFFGTLEDADALTDWAHAHGALAVAVVNPVALGLLKPPGEWGKKGADIACGEGQPLGVPLASGGPYFGFMCCKRAHVRQLPGRVVGRGHDMEGRTGYTLTLQAREQHIRRSKATSNICTNQGLMVTAATIHMALLGSQGLAEVASRCYENRERLVHVLSAIDGVEPIFSGSGFHEAVLRLPRAVPEVLAALAGQGVLGGYNLTPHYPELGNAVLVCATEVRTEDDIQTYAETLETILKSPIAASPRRAQAG
jgi:glycine dehydrogenase subunit 1